MKHYPRAYHQGFSPKINILKEHSKSILRIKSCARAYYLVCFLNMRVLGEVLDSISQAKSYLRGY